MKVMLKYELKRIFTKRLNRVLITIGLALSVILSFLAATSNRFVSPQGHLETGISATRKVVADKNRNKGLMTPKRISELITQDQRVFREYKDKGESDKIYGTSIQQYLDVEQLVSYILTGNEDYNPSVYLDVNPKKLLNIYKIREAKIQKLIRQNGKTEEQRKYLKAQYDKISTPYQYEAPDSWDTMQLYVVTYSIVLAVLMGVLASGIFSEEITLKADAIFFSSKYGRDKAIKTKISAGLITSTGIYWIGMCLFTVISLTLMGTSGSHTLMSILNSYTIYNVTYGQAFYIMMFAGYIANLLATTVSMLVSAIMGSPNIAICIPFFLFCIMPFVGRIGGGKGIFLLTPDQLNNFQEIMKVNHIYQIGGFVTNQLALMVLIYVVVNLVLIPVIYSAYKRKSYTGTIKNKKTGYFKNTNDTINYNTIKERSVLKNYISYKKSGSEENTMKENKVQFIAITAMAVALTYVFTAFVNVRLPIAANGGLIHLGNVPLFIMAILFGKKTGAIAGGVGMGLFDLLSGWTAWAPFTFIIVGIMGYVVGVMTEKHDQYGWKVAAIFAAFVIKIVGYYIAEIILYGNFIAPISSVPGNVVQIAVAAVVVLIVIEPIEIAVKKIGITQFA